MGREYIKMDQDWWKQAKGTKVADSADF